MTREQSPLVGSARSHARNEIAAERNAALLREAKQLAGRHGLSLVGLTKIIQKHSGWNGV